MSSSSTTSRTTWTSEKARHGPCGVVIAQFVLGWLAFFAIMGDKKPEPVMYDQLASAPAIDIAKALVATAHQANGAFLFAIGTLAMVFARRLVGVRDAAPSAR